MVPNAPGDGRFVEQDVDDIKCCGAKAVAMKADMAGLPQPAGLTLGDATYALAFPTRLATGPHGPSYAYLP